MEEKRLLNRKKVIDVLDELGIPYNLYEHPPLPTIEDAVKYWNRIDATHCKNLFFRNHKGNRHYLVIIEHSRQLYIKDLEQRLRQGKISFASPHRTEKYLGLEGGSISAFGLINDTTNHVHVFLDENLKTTRSISFHPNENTATVVISFSSFLKFMDWTGNSYEFIKLYDEVEHQSG